MKCDGIILMILYTDDALLSVVNHREFPFTISLPFRHGYPFKVPSKTLDQRDIYNMKYCSCNLSCTYTGNVTLALQILDVYRKALASVSALGRLTLFKMRNVNTPF